jgi:hypothetical protein
MGNFTFAYEVLYKERPNEILDHPTRDHIFASVLSSFSNGPVNVFQIGAIETFEAEWRIGSGWSDLIWGDYIKKHGGSLAVADISLTNLAHSTLAAVQLGYVDHLVTFCGDAIEYIEEGYDIYYLDGSDDPQEMLDQFNKIKHTNSVVVMDDYSVKGTLVGDQSRDEGYKVTVHQTSHLGDPVWLDLATIDLRKQI